MGELLLEVRCEEIPARMLASATTEAGTRLFEELLAKGLTPGEIETGFTPRRLVLVLKDVPDREPDREEEVTGPPVSVGFDEEGNPTAAALGFAKKCGVVAADLQVISTPKGDYLGTTVRTEGRPASVVIGELVPQILAGLNWAKSMRWGAGEGPWVRPVHGLLVLYEGEVVPCELFGVAAGGSTIGHPIHSPEPFPVSNSVDYYRQMSCRGIEVRFDQRLSLIHI